MSQWATCALCPRLCRAACPVATGSHREAATPTAIATVMLQWERGAMSPAHAAEAASLCVDCGRCQELCHLHRPLPELLREARRELLSPRAPEVLRPIAGTGRKVVVMSDERPVARALSLKLKQPVRSWVTTDRLGVAAIEHPTLWDPQVRRLRQAAEGLELVVTDGGVAHALRSAELPFRWLHELVRELPHAHGSCQTGSTPLGCCGGAEPLAWHHPQDAERVGRAWLARAEEWTVADGRCRRHLERCGGDVRDVVDALLEEVGLV